MDESSRRDDISVTRVSGGATVVGPPSLATSAGSSLALLTRFLRSCRMIPKSMRITAIAIAPTVPPAIAAAFVWLWWEGGGEVCAEEELLEGEVAEEGLWEGEEVLEVAAAQCKSPTESGVA